MPPPHAHSTRANVITHSYERHTHMHMRARAREQGYCTTTPPPHFIAFISLSARLVGRLSRAP